MNAGLHEHARRRGAVLAGVEISGARDACDRRFDLGVIEDDHRRLATELEVNPLEIRRSRLRYLHTRAHRPGDRHHLRNRVGDHGSPGGAVAGDHVEHALRQKLRGDLGKEQGCRGCGVRGLEHGGVARGEGRRELPDRHVERVVPRRHLPDDADRLPSDLRGMVFEIFAGGHPTQVPRLAGKEADLVDREHDLIRHERCPGLTGVFRLEVGELLRVRLHRIGDPKQRELALARGGVAPPLERRRRRGKSGIDIRFARNG